MPTRRSTTYLLNLQRPCRSHDSERQEQTANTDARLAGKCGKIGSECGIFAKPDEPFAVASASYENPLQVPALRWIS
jgi:hypothetical protein